jgi:DNA-binding HxlR family transcriptional regulator
MDESIRAEIVDVFRSRTRVKILYILRKYPEGTARLTQIKKELEKSGTIVSLPNISKHLKVLSEHGLVRVYDWGVPPRSVYKIDMLRGNKILPLLEDLRAHLEVGKLLGELRKVLDSEKDLERRMVVEVDPIKRREIRSKLSEEGKKRRRLVETCQNKGKYLTEEEKGWIDYLAQEEKE